MEIKETRPQQNEDEHWRTPGIEKYAAEKEQSVFVPAIRQLVQQQKNRQKPNQKYDRAENHASDLEFENSPSRRIYLRGTCTTFLFRATALLRGQGPINCQLVTIPAYSFAIFPVLLLYLVNYSVDHRFVRSI
ncbi:MAG: hypothetical protein IPN95_30735 [Bacteroidetes bacterium]|nr:hypothetical protein [Bacteroidota bacterium]